LYELEDRVCISFAGTYEMSHVKLDVNITQEGLDDLGCPEELVHQGFLRAYRSMHQRIEFWLRQDKARSTKPVFLAGHSLGAALATVCVRYISEMDLYKGQPDKIALVTFGSPCAGNQAFADSVECRATEIWRVVYENDLVPRMLLRRDGFRVCSVLACGLCMLCTCPSQFWGTLRGGLCSSTYAHAGVEVLCHKDGMMFVDPEFLEDEFLGNAKHSGIGGTQQGMANHLLPKYTDCLRMWIHRVHPVNEEDLMSKIIFYGEERKSLGAYTLAQ